MGCIISEGTLDVKDNLANFAANVASIEALSFAGMNTPQVTASAAEATDAVPEPKRLLVLFHAYSIPEFGGVVKRFLEIGGDSREAVDDLIGMHRPLNLSLKIQRATRLEVSDKVATDGGPLDEEEGGLLAFFHDYIIPHPGAIASVEG